MGIAAARGQAASRWAESMGVARARDVPIVKPATLGGNPGTTDARHGRPISR